MLKLYCQSSHQPGKPGKVREFDNGQEKFRESRKNREKSGKMCFACGVLLRLQWSQNKHSLTARVLLSVDDMNVCDGLPKK